MVYIKNFIINKCLNYIKKYNNYSKEDIAKIEYGLVSLYLTISKFIIISIISLILGIFYEMIIFTTLFNILRLTAFGLHATKSWICLLTTSITFIGIPYLCTCVDINIYIKMLIATTGIIFMYKNAPADTYKRPIVNKKRRAIYKFISTILSIFFAFLSILVKNNFVSNCLIFSLILENIMISPLTYKIFKLPYNNYITYLKKHPELLNN